MEKINKIQGLDTKRLSKNLKMKYAHDLVKIISGDEVTPIKERKERKKEIVPRKQPEKALRRDVVDELRKRGCWVAMVENSVTRGQNTGLGDLWVMHPHKYIAGWIELKSAKGRLTGNQPKFQELCEKCGVNYWVVKSVDEALEVFGYAKSK